MKISPILPDQQIPSESVDEWKEFVAVAQKPLPSTFRITGSRSHAIYLRDHLKSKYFSQLESAQYGGENSETLQFHLTPFLGIRKNLDGPC